MPIALGGPADLMPLPLFNNDHTEQIARGESIAEAILLAALLVLTAAFFCGRRRYRQWMAARLEECAESRRVLPDALAEGLSATLETPLGAEVWRGAATLQSAQKRWLFFALDAESADAPLTAGTPVVVTVAGETAAFRFHAGVADRREANGAVTLSFPRPPWVERIQRRAFFRIPVSLPTVVTPLTPSREAAPLYRGTIDSLSGGGFRIALPLALAEGARIRVRLPIAALCDPAFEARVVRCAPGPNTDALPYRAHCEFLPFSEETRALLVQYCFEVQREERVKE